MTEQQNTRPSASREIAVKPLEWVDLTGSGYAFNAVTIVGIYNIRINGPEEIWLDKDGTGIGGRFRYIEEAKAAANKHNERRILSAIDTTHGNTDPIAKDDGWREDVDTDFIYPPIPDRSHDWYARFKWHDGDTDLRGHGETELDAVFDLFRNALDFDDGDGSELEAILNAAWIGIGGVSNTEHPTEQPSVRASEHGELCTSPIRSKNHKGEEVVSFDERHTLADIARWISENPVDRDEMVRLLTGGQMEQPSVRDVLSKAANDAIQGYAERTDRYASGFRNGIFTMRKSILRSLAQEGE